MLIPSRSADRDESAAAGMHRAEMFHWSGFARAELAEDFGVAPQRAYCSVIVHFENDRPIQLEDRYVLPKLAPDYLKVDFNQPLPTTTVRVAPLQEASICCAR